MVRIPAGTHLEKPLQIVNVCLTAQSLRYVRRLLVIVEKDASAMILTCDHSKLTHTVRFAAGDRSMARRRCQPRHLRHGGNSGIQRPLLTSLRQSADRIAAARQHYDAKSCGTTRNDMRDRHQRRTLPH